MKTVKILLITVFVSLSFFSHAANLAYEYPELQVTPRASERLKIEAIKEKKSPMAVHRAIQISALTTLTAGLLQIGQTNSDEDPDVEKDNEKSPYLGITIGGSWLAGTFLLKQYINPYRSAYRSIVVTPNRKKRRMTKRELLVQERMSEEAINKAASLGTKLIWFSTITNFATNAYMLSRAKDGSHAKITDALGMLFAWAPIVFPHTWQNVSREQRKYKKKIYAPIAYSTILFDKYSQKAAPGVVFALTF